MRLDSLQIPASALFGNTLTFTGSSSNSLLEALKPRFLLSDGAMGTQLQLAGLESGGCGEAWNVDHPDRILAIQRAYADAGSDIILTNTFGASRIMLGRH